MGDSGEVAEGIHVPIEASLQDFSKAVEPACGQFQFTAFRVSADHYDGGAFTAAAPGQVAYVYITGAVDGVFHSKTVCKLFDLLYRRVGIRSVYRISCSIQSGSLQVAFFHVAGDNRCCACGTRALNSVGPHASEAEYRNGRPGLHSGGMDSRAVAGRDSAPDHAGFVHRHLLRDDNAAHGGNHSIFCES